MNKTVQYADYVKNEDDSANLIQYQDDKFLMEIHIENDSRKIKKIKDLMKKTGAIEIKEKE